MATAEPQLGLVVQGLPTWVTSLPVLGRHAWSKVGAKRVEDTHAYGTGQAPGLPGAQGWLHILRQGRPHGSFPAGVAHLSVPWQVSGAPFTPSHGEPVALPSFG